MFVTYLTGPPSDGTSNPGTGLAAATSILPADLPTTHWHLTARPWSALNIPAPSYSARFTGEIAFWKRTMDGHGCIHTPYVSGYPASGAVSTSWAIGIQQLVDDNYANNSTGIAGINCEATQDAGTTDNTFVVGPVGTVIPLYNGHDGNSGDNQTAWKNAVNHTFTPGNRNNWVTYTMWGAWELGAPNLNLSAWSGSNYPSLIENWWNSSPRPTQATRMSNTPFHFYQDQTGTPDSMNVEIVGRGNIMTMVAEGYAGPSASTMRTDVTTGALSRLLIQDPDGQGATGGRQSDHIWTDVGEQVTFEMMAQCYHAGSAWCGGVVNNILAGQFQHAAELNFQSLGRWAIPAGQTVGTSPNTVLADGAFFETKNHFDPGLFVGYQNGAIEGFTYNGEVMSGTAQAYQQRVKAAITELPVPAEIGGFAFLADAGFSQAFANAGGTLVQASMTGATTQQNGQYWTPLGITRIGRVNWETRLGPSDGQALSLSFGPTWITSGTSWTRLAQQASGYSGTFTTTFANPVLTLAKIVWAPSGSGPTFTQNLTITPDGVLSQTTAANLPVNGLSWGMTLPVMADDGSTTGGWGGQTMTQTISPSTGIATVSYPGGGDEEDFIVISPHTVGMTTEANVQTSYGDVTPVRTYSYSGRAPDATQTTFIYPRNSSDPSGANVRSSMTVTGTNTYTNSLGSVTSSDAGGTVYKGRTSAGGWSNRISIVTTNDVTFSAPCNFILQLTGGKVSAVETDRNVTVTVPAGSTNGGSAHTGLSLTAYTPSIGL